MSRTRTTQMTSIVIPACDIRQNNKEDLENLLTSVSPSFFRGWDQVVVCFDGCKEEFVDYFRQKFPFIHVIWNRGNALGFTNNSNMGLRFVRNELKSGAFLVNQDCVLPAWEHLSKVIGEGLATPMTTDNIDLLTNQPKEVVKTRLTNKFAFFCPYFSYNLLKDVGLLDPDLKVLFSDDCYVFKTLLHGKYPVESVNIYIHHKGSHIEIKEGWESKSGSYKNHDLGIGLLQYRLKLGMQGVPHDSIIPEALKKLTWSDDMRID